MAKGPEKKFEARITPKLRSIENTWWGTTQPGSIRFLPDKWGCVNGVFVWLELKKSEAEAKKKSGRNVMQQHMISVIQATGGYAKFVYPENWEKVYREIQEIAKSMDPMRLVDKYIPHVEEGLEAFHESDYH